VIAGDVVLLLYNKLIQPVSVLPCQEDWPCSVPVSYQVRSIHDLDFSMRIIPQHLLLPNGFRCVNENIRGEVEEELTSDDPCEVPMRNIIWVCELIL